MEAHEAIERYAQMDDQSIALFEAGVSIALIEYPGLDVNLALGKLDELIQKAKVAAWDLNVDLRFRKLNEFFFGILGFKGNYEDYYNPRNSLLNEVLERKVGIPITISVIYLEMAWRLSLDAYGVGFPGHFLIGYRSSSAPPRYIDPFNGGKEVDRDAMKRILDSFYEGRVAFEDSMLQPVTKRQILVRMLNNLKGVYAENKDFRRTLEVMNCICILMPNSPTDFRDRGFVNYELRRYSDALDDLYLYTELEPSASDADSVRRAIQQIKAIVGKLK